MDDDPAVGLLRYQTNILVHHLRHQVWVRLDGEVHIRQHSILLQLSGHLLHEGNSFGVALPAAAFQQHGCHDQRVVPVFPVICGNVDLLVLKVAEVGSRIFVVLLDVVDGGNNDGAIHFEVDSCLIAHRYTHTDAHIVVDAVSNADFRVTRGVCDREQFPVLVKQTDLPHTPTAHIGRDGGCGLDDILVHQISGHLCRTTPYFMDQRCAGRVRHWNTAVSVADQHPADGQLFP